MVRLKTPYDDGALVIKLLIPAKEVAGTRVVACGLEEALLKDWSAQAKSIDRVFSLLKLKREGTGLFQSPVTAIWASYVTKLDDETAAFTTLQRHFGDVQLARMLGGAKHQAELTKASDMETFTGRLLNLQFKSWFNERLTPAAVASKLSGYDSRDSKVYLAYFGFYRKATRV